MEYHQGVRQAITLDQIVLVQGSRSRASAANRSPRHEPCAAIVLVGNIAHLVNQGQCLRMCLIWSCHVIRAPRIQCRDKVIRWRRASLRRTNVVASVCHFTFLHCSHGRLLLGKFSFPTQSARIVCAIPFLTHLPCFGIAQIAPQCVLASRAGF